MSDPVLGNSARWHSTSPLYGEDLDVPLVPSAAATIWRLGLGPMGELCFSAVTLAVTIGDASRHDL